MNAPLPPDEAQRLESLRRYGVLDTFPEQSFDDLTMLAAHICQSPMAQISLIDENRQWFKSKIGITASETPRDIAFCAHTILHKDEVFEVRDAQADPRFSESLLVTDSPHVRFYAGAPLITPDGHALGAICVMDRNPRKLSEEQLAALRALSRQVVTELELRRQTLALIKETEERQRVQELLQKQFDQLSQNKAESERLLALAQKSRRALLSVLEDEKRTGNALRESEEKFRQLAENINEVFWMTAPAENQMLYISPAYEKIWGRTCGSLYASPQSWIEAIHPADRERIVQAAKERQSAGTYDEEYRVIRPDKSIRWIRDRAFPVRGNSGEIQRIVGVARDITENRKLEEQFRQSQKMEGIGQLAGGVAHDFNNILAIIQMQSDLLRDGGGLSDNQAAFANEISMTVERAAALTRQLLLFSRREVFQPRDLDLSASITNTTKMLVRVIGENIQIELKLASQPLFIHADASMIDQVLLNLAVNARDAMPNGGHLIIETMGVEFDESTISQEPPMRAGTFVRLSVSDTGCGMPPEIISKIFEPFFTTKDVGKGTGLGLATVFGVVQQHQGWINVYSEVGHGTTFRIYLPRLANNKVPAVERFALTAMRGGNETILLVEDDPTLRRSVRQALAQLGYRILEAPTGRQALEVWKENRDEIRVLLTDLVMPDGMTGKELAERLHQENSKLNVIYMSGYSAEVVGKDFPLKEGINFLTKPFQAAKLAQTIRANLDSNISQTFIAHGARAGHDDLKSPING